MRKVRVNKGKVRGDLAEIRAYRELSGQSFDFGTGLITDDSTTSEDAYYEMDEWELENLLDNHDVNMPKRKREKLNRYARKQQGKHILEHKYKNGNYFIYEHERDGKKFLKRWYISGPRKYAKKQTNRKLRNTRKEFNSRCGGYRKEFDYWNTLF